MERYVVQAFDVLAGHISEEPLSQRIVFLEHLSIFVHEIGQIVLASARIESLLEFGTQQFEVVLY